MRLKDSLGAEAHNEGSDDIAVDESGLNVNRESEWSTRHPLALVVGVLDLGLAGYGKHNAVEVDPVQDQQTGETAENLAKKRSAR
jgi:hypothetical protein